jgi:hypothetical protein
MAISLMETGNFYLRFNLLIDVHLNVLLRLDMNALEVAHLHQISVPRCVETVLSSKDQILNIAMMETLILMMGAMPNAKLSLDFSVAEVTCNSLIYALRFVVME